MLLGSRQRQQLCTAPVGVGGIGLGRVEEQRSTLTVALARRRGLDAARLGELQRARPVDGDATEGRRVAAERGAQALRAGLHDAGELRAARRRRRRHVAADVVEARVQADERGRAPGLRRRRGRQRRRRHGGRQEPRHGRRRSRSRRHFSPHLTSVTNARGLSVPDEVLDQEAELPPVCVLWICVLELCSLDRC
jgi:hypothetical protein